MHKQKTSNRRHAQITCCPRVHRPRLQHVHRPLIGYLFNCGSMLPNFKPMRLHLLMNSSSLLHSIPRRPPLLRSYPPPSPPFIAYSSPRAHSLSSPSHWYYFSLHVCQHLFTVTSHSIEQTQYKGKGWLLTSSRHFWSDVGLGRCRVSPTVGMKEGRATPRPVFFLPFH